MAVMVNGGGSSGGSTIRVITEDSRLYGGTCMISCATGSVTARMSSAGETTFRGVSFIGEVTVTVTNGSNVGTDTFIIPYYGMYEIEVADGDIYQINITTTETTLYGKLITATYGQNTKTSVFSSDGEAVLKIFGYTGSVELSSTDGSKTATTTVEISSSSLTYNVSLLFVQIYGASWDGTSGTGWTRTDASADFTDPVPYVSGASSYSSPFDNLYPWSGMVKSSRTGGVMVAIPKFWYKITQSGAGIKIQIADAETDGFSASPLHMDRGDGKGERDVAYIGRYHCGSSDYKSVTGTKPKVSITRSAARTSIHNLGSTIWQSDFSARFTIWLLYIVEFADWNSQAKIGYGCAPTGSTSAVRNMGYTDSMPYHTGTDQSSRTTYGGTQYRNIEGLWDNCYDWMDGCYYASNGMNVILNPNSFSDSSGGVNIGTPTSGYPSAFAMKNVSGSFPCFIPSASSGSDSTFSCDSWGFYASRPCLYVGGNYGQGGSLGLFYVGNYSATYADAYIGCRLLELP